MTVRYAGASGDFNPIHIDESFAREVGLPGRILHGLWTMAQVARAATEAGGGPEALRSLSVEFRGMGRMEEEIVVSGQVTDAAESAGDGGGSGADGGAGGAVVRAKLEAVQDGHRIIRNGVAELRVGSS